MFSAVIAAGALVSFSNACSNIIVSPGASSDGSSIVSYNADSGTLYGSLYHYPAADHQKGSMRDVYDWDSGVYLGQIPESEHTYNVVGNLNEFGVVIGETTYGGIEALQSQEGALIDYGSLIWITLQRSKSAREAISVMDELMQTYGYASEGESFSVGDKNEVWIMDIIGKGNYEKGSVWVARRIPDGYVSGHANQARITTFPLDDNANCVYSKDVISFARSIGLYSDSASDSEFSFSDTYDPLTFSGARACEARVFDAFSSIVESDSFYNQYLDYAQGYNLTNRMPLWVEPKKKLSVPDVMELMRSHYEGTWFDMSGTREPDAGAFDSNLPYRWRPLSWQYDDKTYYNERAIATQQTGWNFVSQSRKNVPPFMAGLLWFAVDESATSVHFPIYGSATRIPEAFAGKGAQDGVVTPIMEFSMETAFSVFNLVANFAYSRWNVIYPEVYNHIVEIESQYAKDVKALEKQAMTLYDNGSGAERESIQMLTEYSVTCGNNLVREWRNFFGQLFVKYRDGYVITPNESNKACGCSVGNEAYSNQWLGRIVSDTGDRYLDPSSLSDTGKVKEGRQNQKPAHLLPVDKRSLKSFK